MTQEALESSVAADDGVPAGPPPRRIVPAGPSGGPPAEGRALIVAGSQSLFKPGVVLAGASGMTLAESTAYLMGVIGRGLAEERQAPLKGGLGRWGDRSGRRLGWV